MGLNLRDILLVAGDTIAFVTKTNTAWLRMSAYSDEREAKDAEVNTKAQQAAQSATAAAQDASAAQTAKQQAESAALAAKTSAQNAAKADGILQSVQQSQAAAAESAKNAALSASDSARANQIAIDNARLAIDAAAAAKTAKDQVAGSIGTAAEQAAAAAKTLLDQEMAGYIQQAQTARAGAEAAAAASVNPVGTIIFYAKSTVPTGYLKANGAAVSRTSYSALFAVLGTIFGSGDGSTTFNVPDLRGEFLRGWDDGRGVDVDRAFGSNQNDVFKSHSHKTYRSSTTAGSGLYVAAPYTGSDALQPVGDTIAAGGVETRPRNIALLACIRY